MPRALSADTDPRVERILFDSYGRLTPAEKLARISRMWSVQIRLARAGLRSRYPQAGPEEMRKRLCALLHGRETALAVFGWDPEREGY